MRDGLRYPHFRLRWKPYLARGFIKQMQTWAQLRGASYKPDLVQSNFCLVLRLKKWDESNVCPGGGFFILSTVPILYQVISFYNSDQTILTYKKVSWNKCGVHKFIQDAEWVPTSFMWFRSWTKWFLFFPNIEKVFVATGFLKQCGIEQEWEVQKWVLISCLHSRSCTNYARTHSRYSISVSS